MIKIFRLWAKEFKDTRMIKDMVVENDDSSLNRTKKIFASLEKVCKDFDLSSPIWFDNNIKDFKAYDKVRFYADNFIDSIDFDYLEIHIIEE